jgi:hypothetical protein
MQVQDVMTAVAVMRERGLRHLPVVDGEGRLIGISIIFRSMTKCAGSQKIRSATRGPAARAHHHQHGRLPASWIAGLLGSRHPSGARSPHRIRLAPPCDYRDSLAPYHGTEVAPLFRGRRQGHEREDGLVPLDGSIFAEAALAPAADLAREARLVLGSVAERVLRSTAVAILPIRPDGARVDAPFMAAPFAKEVANV